MFKVKKWHIAPSDDSHPRELMIEVSNKCNYNCIYCFRNLMKDPEGFMEPELYYKIVEEAYDIGVEKITFSGWGEPLLHPKIRDFIKKAKDLELKVLLNTNGYYLRENIGWVKELVDELYVSMDSSESNLYSLLRKGGDLSRLLSALEDINKFRREKMVNKPEIIIQFTLTKLNVDNLVKTIELAGKLKATRFIVSNILPLTPGQEKSLACYMDDSCKEKIAKISGMLARLSMIHNILISLPQLDLTTERECPFASRDALFIRWDGKVAPCIYMAHGWVNTFYKVTRTINPVILGDLKKESLIDIWNSEEYMKYKFNLDFMYYPSCPDCPLRDYCTFTLSNDMDCWGNQPSCASCPYARDIVRCPL
ncbi:MAG: tungsten cofactor oxidoreductase radical SAM maturase [Desulfurococcales archaeon]|nr:tungsten cofactor oxidoreductase radical SAM maturase [Desulfurococcales archaeon]